MGETGAMDLVHAAIDVLHAYFELGNDTRSTAGATLVSSAACPQIYDANCVTRIRAGTADEIDDLFAAADEHYAGLTNRTFKVDPRTPAAVEARLVLGDFEVDVELQSVLEGDLQVPAGIGPPGLDVRPLAGEDDWASLGRLMRVDHEETAANRGAPCWDQSVTDEMLDQRRRKAPAVQFFLARLDGVDCAFFSSWPGVGGRGGLGKLEDLFTLPAYRHRGIASALMVQAADDARARGAGPLLIGAVADDTPKAMYAAMGFRPLLVYRSYTRPAAT